MGGHKGGPYTGKKVRKKRPLLSKEARYAEIVPQWPPMAPNVPYQKLDSVAGIDYL
jgi:hypothetical protein